MEKLKIYVTEQIAKTLEKDTEGFEFFKKDRRTINKNAFLTSLIINYHNNFAEQQTQLFSFLKNKISSSAKISEVELNSLCFDLCEKLNDKKAAPNNEKFDQLISLKPTKESEPIIEYIEEYCLMGRTLSEYFRSMFASYCAQPQDKRELIIFKPQYDAITKAIKNKKRVFITTRWSFDQKIECAPYTIATSKEELHCYVLVATKSCTPIRLSRIVSIKELPNEAEFTEGQLEIFEKMKKYGPQFIYRQNDEEVLVELTAKGIDKFKKIYVHRPVPTKIENNYYYFNCAHSQIVQYFIRLGSDAKVIYPQRVKDEILNFHRRALNKYLKKPKSILNQEDN